MYVLKIPVASCFLAIGVTKASPRFSGHKKKASKIDTKLGFAEAASLAKR